MTAILIIAAAVRFYGIDRRSIWFDEAVTLGVARLPLVEHLRHAWDVSLNNQLFYYLLYRPWHSLGEAEATVRAFSAICSVAGVAVLYFLGRRLFGTAAGIIAALVLALHSGSIWYAQEARSYSLAIFLATLSSLFLVRHVQNGALRDLVFWVVASSLSCYSHFFAGLAIEAQVISLAALGIHTLRQRKGLLWGVVIIALITLPIVVHMILSPKGIVNWIPEISWKSILNVVEFLAGGNLVLLVFFLSFVLVLLAKPFLTRSASDWWNNALVVAWALLPLLTLAAVSLIQPILINRYAIFAVPGWALAAGAVLGNLLERSRVVKIGACMALGLLFTAEAYEIRISNDLPFEDWRLPAAQVAAATLPGDVIIYNTTWAGLPFEYYLDRAPLRPRALQAGNLLIGETDYIQNLNQYVRVWLVTSRQDNAKCKMLSDVLVRGHPFVSWKEYNAAVITVVLFDVRPRASGAGAFK